MSDDLVLLFSLAGIVVLLVISGCSSPPRRR
jgi:hypothetical protein